MLALLQKSNISPTGGACTYFNVVSKSGKQYWSKISWSSNSVNSLIDSCPHTWSNIFRSDTDVIPFGQTPSNDLIVVNYVMQSLFDIPDVISSCWRKPCRTSPKQRMGECSCCNFFSCDALKWKNLRLITPVESLTRHVNTLRPRPCIDALSITPCIMTCSPGINSAIGVSRVRSS